MKWIKKHYLIKLTPIELRIITDSLISDAATRSGYKDLQKLTDEFLDIVHPDRVVESD